jgi:DNA polymerase-3 subunit gamma/tau
MLSSSAFNALLKTIEEPPPYIVFIFATTELHKVPATIKSRCQQFNFRLISVETIQVVLRKICTEMKIEAEDDALFWIARESTGSMRDALTLFDQVVSFSAGNIRSGLIREKLGIIGLEKLNALAENCAAEDAQSALTLADEILSSGAAIEQFIIDMAGYYRSLLLLKNGITRESLLGYRPAQFSAKVLETLDSIRIERALEILLDCYRNIRYSLSPRFELDTAVSKLVWLSRWVSPVELQETVNDVRSVLGERPSPDLPPSNTPVVNPVKTDVQYSSNRSLSDEFKRMVAAKTGLPANQTSEDDEDVPLWDNTVNKPESVIQPQVERVLSMFPGTIIE